MISTSWRFPGNNQSQQLTDSEVVSFKLRDDSDNSSDKDPNDLLFDLFTRPLGQERAPGGHGWTVRKLGKFWERERGRLSLEMEAKVRRRGCAAGRRAVGGPTCRGCADGFICGGGGVANTTEGGCPGGNEGCKRKEVMSPAESEGGVCVIYGWKKVFKM